MCIRDSGGIGFEPFHGKPLHIRSKADSTLVVGSHAIVWRIDGDFLSLRLGKSADDQNGLQVGIDAFFLERGKDLFTDFPPDL